MLIQGVTRELAAAARARTKRNRERERGSPDGAVETVHYAPEGKRDKDPCICGITWARGGPDLSRTPDPELVSGCAVCVSAAASEPRRIDTHCAYEDIEDLLDSAVYGGGGWVLFTCGRIMGIVELVPQVQRIPHSCIDCGGYIIGDGPGLVTVYNAR